MPARIVSIPTSNAVRSAPTSLLSWRPGAPTLSAAPWTASTTRKALGSMRSAAQSAVGDRGEQWLGGRKPAGGDVRIGQACECQFSVFHDQFPVPDRPLPRTDVPGGRRVGGHHCADRAGGDERQEFALVGNMVVDGHRVDVEVGAELSHRQTA